MPITSHSITTIKLEVPTINGFIFHITENTPMVTLLDCGKDAAHKSIIYPGIINAPSFTHFCCQPMHKVSIVVIVSPTSSLTSYSPTPLEYLQLTWSAKQKYESSPSLLCFWHDSWALLTSCSPMPSRIEVPKRIIEKWYVIPMNNDFIKNAALHWKSPWYCMNKVNNWSRKNQWANSPNFCAA